ncbi:putative calcium homeostasis protein Regucalcin [Talaromyces proteolyticus]|uniref:Calcium homeostasis protein Regucalcin n=1 Tax=Talaromyces proteolyticus TaxID=1131652 RepID=A0AAD4Q281_9EURO|nr:putative calcium homeostasis protein Regucalcin [Talaromyces proteolyticus]KAH8700192.1 putative calcium homeostasis protein Regucalcin [Talaromyces proteolyticus]
MAVPSSGANLQKWTVTEPYLDIRGGLLEGPYYTPARNELRFIDIDHEKAYFLDLAKGPESLRVVSVNSPIGVTTDVADGSADNPKILVAAKHGFATLDRQSGSLTYVNRVYNDSEASYRMRFNDGAVDSHGRFWAGSCNDHRVVKVEDQGTLYRLDPDLSVHVMVNQMICPNGIGWNATDDVMYLTDSPRGKIYAYDYDAQTGAISNRRDFFTLDASIGEPDGFAMDVEGCLWVAIWRGSRILRVNSQGEVTGEISFPTRFITCPEFVGTELIVTTALEKEPLAYPESVRWSGKVYKLDVGVQGKPRTPFRPW